MEARDYGAHCTQCAPRLELLACTYCCPIAREELYENTNVWLTPSSSIHIVQASSQESNVFLPQNHSDS